VSDSGNLIFDELCKKVMLQRRAVRYIVPANDDQNWTGWRRMFLILILRSMARVALPVSDIPAWLGLIGKVRNIF